MCAFIMLGTLNARRDRLTRMQLVIITGLSGSGKSVALKALEDSAYYTTDNLPAKLLPALVDFLREAGHPRVAVSIDGRSGDTLSQLPLQVNELKARRVDVRVLFLDAKSETLVKRFSETRPPWSSQGIRPRRRTARERTAPDTNVGDPPRPDAGGARPGAGARCGEGRRACG